MSLAIDYVHAFIFITFMAMFFYVLWEYTKAHQALRKYIQKKLEEEQ